MIRQIRLVRVAHLQGHLPVDAKHAGLFQCAGQDDAAAGFEADKAFVEGFVEVGE